MPDLKPEINRLVETNPWKTLNVGIGSEKTGEAGLSAKVDFLVQFVSSLSLTHSEWQELLERLPTVESSEADNYTAVRVLMGIHYGDGQKLESRRNSWEVANELGLSQDEVERLLTLDPLAQPDSIEHLGLDVRTLNALLRHRIVTVAQLGAVLSERSGLAGRVRGVGTSAEQEIVAKFEAFRAGKGPNNG